MRTDAAIVLTVGAFGVSFIGGMQLADTPTSKPPPVGGTAPQAISLAAAAPLPVYSGATELAARVRTARPKKKARKRPPTASAPAIRRVVAAPPPAPAPAPPPRSPVVRPTAPVIRPAATPAPTARATPAPTFDDNGRPDVGSFDYGGGGR